MSRTARRLSLAVAGIGFAGLAAFATAGPAAADNGPHQLMSGSVSTADGCAGCHRMHSAKVGGDELFKAAAEGSEFCETCHDGSQASTDVIDGVSTMTSDNGVKDTSDTATMKTGVGTFLNTALRGGGFQYSRIGASSAVQGNIYWYAARSSWSPNKYALSTAVGVHANSAGITVWGDMIPAVESQTSTSQHTLGVINQTLWGSNTTGTGASVELECVSCHNPHGNGSYRILRPVGFDGNPAASVEYQSATNIFTQVGVVDSTTSYTAVADPVNNQTSIKWAETITLTAAPTFIPGQPVIIRAGTTDVAEPNTTNYGVGTVYSVDAVNKQIVIGNSGSLRTIPSGTSTYISPAFPNTIIQALYDSDTTTGWIYKFYTASDMKLVPGVKLTVETLNKKYNVFALKQATVLAAGTVTETTTMNSGLVFGETATYTAGWFTLTVPGTGTHPADANMSTGLYILGIPDAKDVTRSGTSGTVANPGIPVGATGDTTTSTGKVYTTANYFLADDLYYSGTYTQPYNKSSVTSSPYIASVSQWCSTCHTRYLSDNRKMQDPSVGTAYSGTYKHRSNSGSNGSPNCIQCHVAHGSSAKVDGVQSSQVTYPSMTTGATENSVLLRVDNRGICLMCHNPYGIS